MRNAAISFPIFGEGFSINPPAFFKIMGFTFYYYGVIIALGFLLAILYCTKRCNDFGITEDNFIDMLLLSVPLGIIGARAYYVIFNFQLYADDLWSIFNTRNGGMAIYGGVIGGVLGAFLMSIWRKYKFIAMLDVGAFGLLIAQSVGRWGNFINREAYGLETTSIFRMGLTPSGAETFYVHPTFLYESLWNLLGFILLHIFSKKDKRKYDGQIFIMYAGWYGFGRMFIEGLRVDSLYIGSTSIRVSQVLAGLTFAAAAALLLIFKFKIKPQPEKMLVNIKKLQTASAAEDIAGETVADAERVSEFISEDRDSDSSAQETKSDNNKEE